MLPMTQRPAMRERTSRSARLEDSPRKRSARSGARPMVLPSRMPETDSDSWTRLEISDIDCWRWAAMRLRCAPTRLVSRTKNGTRTSAKTARRQSSRNMATTVAMTVVRLDAVEVAVVVTTDSTPPMSLAMRDWTSPVRVRVKKASERRCRCS